MKIKCRHFCGISCSFSAFYYILHFKSLKRWKRNYGQSSAFVQALRNEVPIATCSRNVIANVQAYVTLTWMRFSMRIGPPSRERQNLEGRRRRRWWFYESREKFCLWKCARRFYLLFSFSFSIAFFLFLRLSYVTTIVCAKSLLRAKTRTLRANKDVRNVPSNEITV